MNFSLQQSISILERTPFVIEQLLNGLQDEWIFSNEGGETWSPYDVIGHMIHGEKSDWIARLEIILSDLSERRFTPFNRFAQFEESSGKSLKQLLNEFRTLRERNIAILKSKKLTEPEFVRIGIHPDLGNVSLKNLIATWAVHDLNHLSQIARVMAHQYKDEVGPWKEYLRILK
jgi:hypothetical protein